MGYDFTQSSSLFGAQFLLRFQQVNLGATISYPSRLRSVKRLMLQQCLFSLEHVSSSKEVSGDAISQSSWGGQPMRFTMARILAS